MQPKRSAILNHPTVRQVRKIMRDTRHSMCGCGHLVKEHFGFSECGRCDCVQLRIAINRGGVWNKLRLIE